MDVLQRESGWFLALGVLMIVLGVAAIALPGVATLAVEVLLGWILVIVGAAQIGHAFRARRWRGFLFSLLGGILSLATGALMIFFPFSGALAVSWLLAAFLVVQGLVQLIGAFRIRPAPNWIWTLVSGLVALLLGIFVWAQWPSGALWVVGLLVGASLVASGWALITLALAGRRRRREDALQEL